MAVIAPLLGVFLVIRRQSLLGRYTFACLTSGDCTRLFVNWNPTITTLLVVIAAAFILEALRQVYRSYL